MRKYDITTPAQVFNLDETGFATREAGVSGREKRAVVRGQKVNGLQLLTRVHWPTPSRSYRMRAYHGDACCLRRRKSVRFSTWNPVVVVPGVRMRVRGEEKGKLCRLNHTLSETFFLVALMFTCVRMWQGSIPMMTSFNIRILFVLVVRRACSCSLREHIRTVDFCGPKSPPFSVSCMRRKPLVSRSDALGVSEPLAIFAWIRTPTLSDISDSTNLVKCETEDIRVESTGFRGRKGRPFFKQLPIVTQ